GSRQAESNSSRVCDGKQPGTAAATCTQETSSTTCNVVNGFVSRTRRMRATILCVYRRKSTDVSQIVKACAHLDAAGGSGIKAWSRSTRQTLVAALSSKLRT